jgi:ABC-2 type transport system ATP-binding protein
MGATVANQSGTPSPRPRGVAISCRGVTAGYLGSQVLKDISFEIREPAVYVVLGPNGAGKTTLFRTLAGILQPYSGGVYIDGQPIDRQQSRDHVHFLTHMDGMPDGLLVREALDFYARAERATPADVERVMDTLGIRELGDKYLSQLSAGQKKRASIARVFLRDREVYLLDEPTTSLDPGAAREIRSRILELSRDRIVLYSSHNLFEAREIGNYVLLIRNGRLALFDQLRNLRALRFTIGVRLLEPSAELAGWAREGDFFLRELSGPEAVPDLLSDLVKRGIKVREVREMDNPLEELFE